MSFTTRQKQQIRERGITPKEIEQQLDRFKTGMVYSRLDRPAIADDGIIRTDAVQQAHFQELYLEKVAGKQVMKFVPASGAATRMFKDLYELADHTAPDELNFEHLSEPVKKFASNLSRFAFFRELMEVVAYRHPGAESPRKVSDIYQIVRSLLLSNGLNYGSLPKAMLTFHNYGFHTRYAFEEHLPEIAWLTRDAAGPYCIHFTVSPHHLGPFQKLMKKKLPVYRSKYHREYRITWSVQSPHTDTIAVDEQNEPFTDHKGNFLFRPGGHGALIHNLNSIDADLIFIKNIDNVAIEPIEKENVAWRMLLGGVLIELQEKVHHYLTLLSKGTVKAKTLAEITGFIREQFSVSFNPEEPKLLVKLQDFLNRPIRVCGMVRNTGEPGGGPFWVRKGDEVSLQIIESAQIQMDDPKQKQIALAATHFNPVDLVCGVRDYKGKKFDLTRFVDPDTSFISVKSHQGKVLKALELPGLWNGAMANWLTLFVEVPLITFNPVKTVNDLLRPEHQTR
ncbi:MAG TPA: DUF4301 family protein [Bacteroidales bacterium]|nr:DUF4301 family protein [Bacteroidales bacterium]HRZ48681.1 DUF4301 family protein [Bacteroidales bacterium]